MLILKQQFLLQVDEMFFEGFKRASGDKHKDGWEPLLRGDVRGAGFVPPSAVEATKEQIQSHLCRWQLLPGPPENCTHFLRELNLLKLVVHMVRLPCYVANIFLSYI